MAEFEFIERTGLIIPDTADVLAGVVTEYRGALGEDLAVTPDTPQGVLVAAETAARVDALRIAAEVANQINPDIAGGVFLDALCAFLGLQRATATRSLVRDVTLTGQPSTTVPPAVRARTTAGDLFESVGGVVLDSLGVGIVDFQSVEFGGIPAAPGTLTAVVDSVLGWETVDNTIAATLGTDEQSDASLRDLRRRTLARQGISTVEAQVSDISALPGVRSMQFRENIAATTQVIDGITMVAHSVWACVDGGVDADIAAALLENKTNGAGWNGAVTVNVAEPASGQTYPVKFDRPVTVPMLVRVTVRAGLAIVDPQISVRDAVMAYVDGLIPDERGFVVGSDVSPFELAGAITAYGLAGLYVQKVEVAPVSTGVYQVTEYAIATNEVAVTQTSSITVIEL